MDHFLKKLVALTQELVALQAAGRPTDFCLRKIRACSDGDLAAYCNTLEEELAALERTDELTAEIVPRLRERLADAERQLEAATGLITDHVDRDQAMDRLIQKLEAENRREAAAARTAEARLQRVLLDLSLERKARKAAEGQLGRLRRATWAPEAGESE